MADVYLQEDCKSGNTNVAFEDSNFMEHISKR